MKVGYLGPRNSFTYKAASVFFEGTQLQALPTIVSVLKEVEASRIDYGVVPIENSIEGTVNPALDFLYHYGSVPIQRELILPISQHLMVHPKWINQLDQITFIKSHPQALAQTEQFLAEKFPNIKQELTDSTTQAAQWIFENKDQPVMAIASKEAAEYYDLEIVHRNIQDMVNNQTRFWVIGREKITVSPSLVLLTRKTLGIKMKKNQAGNLHKILSVFSWRGIDLTKIQSRPLKTQLGEYFFLIDINVGNDYLVEMALIEIKELGGEIKDFGSYKVYQF